MPGQEYNYVDDWGEQMNDKSTSVVVILDWISEDLQGNFKISLYKNPFSCSYLLSTYKYIMSNNFFQFNVSYWSQMASNCKQIYQFTFSYLHIKVKVLIARSIQLGFAVDVFDVVIKVI